MQTSCTYKTLVCFYGFISEHEPLISITEGNEKPKMKTETAKKKTVGEKSQEVKEEKNIKIQLY